MEWKGMERMLTLTLVLLLTPVTPQIPSFPVLLTGGAAGVSQAK